MPYDMAMPMMGKTKEHGKDMKIKNMDIEMLDDGTYTIMVHMMGKDSHSMKKYSYPDKSSLASAIKTDFLKSPMAASKKKDSYVAARPVSKNHKS